MVSSRTVCWSVCWSAGRLVERDVRDVGLVVAPGDALRGRGRLDGGGVVAVEVVPGPGEEGVGLAVRAAEQHRVHAEPRRERDRALDLVAVLADLGDGGVAADHRHDALVLVVERARSCSRLRSRRMFCAAQRPGLLRDRAELRAACRRRRRGCSRRHRRRRHPGSRRRSRSGCTSIRPPRPRAAARALRDRRCGLAASPHHGPGRDRGPVVELHPSACTAATPAPSRICAPASVSLRARTGGPCRRTRRAAPPRGRPGTTVPALAVLPSARSAAISSTSAPVISTPVGPPPTTTTFLEPLPTPAIRGSVLAARPAPVAEGVRRPRPSTAGTRARPRRGRRRSSAVHRRP